MLTDIEIAGIVGPEEADAIKYNDELNEKREVLLNYYNMRPYGDEVEGQSKAITSDVSDVIEWMLPSLLRIFTQGKLIAKFEGDSPDYDEEAKQKTYLSNYAFTRENNGTLTLHNMFKDALLQYIGVVKVVWEEKKKTKRVKYQGLSEQEYSAVVGSKDYEVSDVEEIDNGDGTTSYNIVTTSQRDASSVTYYNIPPDEFLSSRDGRDFEAQRFIGHRSPKRRSDLIEMGFDEDVVNSLPAYDTPLHDGIRNARADNLAWFGDSNPSNHKANDTIYLGEYYIQIDDDGDGITSLHKVFYAGGKVLEHEAVEDHPFAVCVPIPTPHRAIGSCPAEQVAPIQFRKSVLVRNLLNNIYQTNYPRVMYSNKVDLDDLLTPRAGGAIEIDTDAPDVAGHAQPLIIPTMIEPIMSAIEYTDMEREVRTGVTRYSQGLDAESLNKTATGFKGIMDASQQRIEMIARLFADGGVKQIFTKTIQLMTAHQKTAVRSNVAGKHMMVDPSRWGDNTKCRVDVGLGSGDRNEKIANLNNILGMQQMFMANQLVLSDQAKMYKTLEKIIDEVGLKEVSEYFNNPEVEEETLFAQNQQLVQMVQQLQGQIQNNPLAEAEMIKAQAKMVEAQGKGENEMKQFILKMAQEDKHFAAELARDLTKLELEYQKNVPGAVV
jgi:hypothetical protein